jgi:hypothetical protein
MRIEALLRQTVRLSQFWQMGLTLFTRVETRKFVMELSGPEP